MIQAVERKYEQFEKHPEKMSTYFFETRLANVDTSVEI